MEMMPVKPERMAQLEDYAQRHGQDVVAALDEVLSTYLEWERREYEEAIAGIREGPLSGSLRVVVLFPPTIENSDRLNDNLGNGPLHIHRSGFKSGFSTLMLNYHAIHIIVKNGNVTLKGAVLRATGHRPRP